VPVTSVCDARSIAKSSIGEDLDFGPSFAEAVGVLAQKIFHRFHTFVELKVVSTQGDLVPYLPTGKLCSCATAS